MGIEITCPAPGCPKRVAVEDAGNIDAAREQLRQHRGRVHDHSPEGPA